MIRSGYSNTVPKKIREARQQISGELNKFAGMFKMAESEEDLFKYQVALSTEIHRQMKTIFPDCY